MENQTVQTNDHGTDKVLKIVKNLKIWYVLSVLASVVDFQHPGLVIGPLEVTGIFFIILNTIVIGIKAFVLYGLFERISITVKVIAYFEIAYIVTSLFVVLGLVFVQQDSMSVLSEVYGHDFINVDKHYLYGYIMGAHVFPSITSLVILHFLDKVEPYFAPSWINQDLDTARR